jgi:hypothetical protein
MAPDGKLVFSGHAKDVMSKRRISEAEVEQAHRRRRVETPGGSRDRVNLWGETDQGRRLRITAYRNYPEFVISVVAPDEEDQ